MQILAILHIKLFTDSSYLTDKLLSVQCHGRVINLLLFDAVQEYQRIVDTEWKILYDKLDLIHKSGAKVVLSKLPIGDVATQYFADRWARSLLQHSCSGYIALVSQASVFGLLVSEASLFGP